MACGGEFLFEAFDERAVVIAGAEGGDVVVEDLAAGEDEFFGDGALACGEGGFAREERGVFGGETGFEGVGLGLERSEVGAAAGEGLDGDGDGAVPVVVEDPGGVADDWASGEEVEVAHVVGFVEAEVFVGDVAATDDGAGIVHDEHFVMHAVVEASEVEDEVEFAEPAPALGIEETDFDVRVGGHGGQGAVAEGGVEVVDEEADADPAAGGGEDGVGEEEADGVRGPEEVLDVERLGGAGGEEEPVVEGVDVGVDDGDA